MSAPRLVITEVDPRDAGFDVAFQAWHAVYAAAERHGREDTATPWQRDELRVQLQEPSIRRRSTVFAGRLNGELVATGLIETPLLDNLERCELSVHVLPGHRRRGLGTAMLAHLERVAGERGRRVLGGETSYAYEAGPEGVGESGPEFARARGYDLAIGDVQRVLRLPVEERLLDRLDAEAAPHHTAYRLRSWVGPVPEELLGGWAALTATLNTEAPTGGLDLEPESAEPAAVREGEALAAKQGRTMYNTVALAPDGALVAYTDLVTTGHEPGRAYQWGTLVRRDHRGHRLGVAVKVANLRLLQAERPDIDHLVTWNAEGNGPMVAVNELLGFEPVARLAEFQKRLG
ncbi:GNAT family N-acetyltransferase [Nocardioides pantholopis]|uniref:GNAT family N-acetyltransferase n=1 Tax=Nocardioides pantholopis TaxID=2483798 RepID=UPI000FD84C5B|nr:GNAT family N-acetyltransferase [Nocardioides pantholopis]